MISAYCDCVAVSPGRMCMPDVLCVSYCRKNCKRNIQALHGLPDLQCWCPVHGLTLTILWSTHTLGQVGQFTPIADEAFPWRKFIFPTAHYWVEKWDETYTGRWELLSSFKAKNIVVGAGFWSIEILCRVPFCSIKLGHPGGAVRVPISFSTGELPTVSNFICPWLP